MILSGLEIKKRLGSDIIIDPFNLQLRIAGSGAKAPPPKSADFKA